MPQARCVPVSCLPAARRRSGVSRPWSSALRTRCTSGSLIFSSTVLSSSVPSPDELEFDLLAELARRSCTMRGKRLNAKLIGSMRICITLSCSSRVLRASCERPWRSRSRSSGSMPSAKPLSIDWVMSKFADQVDDVVDLFGGHADGAGFAGRFLRGRRPPPPGCAAAATGRASATGAALRRRDRPPSGGAERRSARCRAGSGNPPNRIPRRAWRGESVPIFRCSTTDSRIPGRAHRAAAAARHPRARVKAPRLLSSANIRVGSLRTRSRSATGSKAIRQPAAPVTGAAALGRPTRPARGWRRDRRGCRVRRFAEYVGDVGIERCDAAFIERFLRFGRRDHFAQAIAGLQQGLDGFGRDRPHAVAHLVEQRLHAVREIGNLGKSEGRRAALDGMSGAEDGIDVFRVGGGAEAQEPRLHHVETLAALLEEDFGDFRHFRIKCHARILRHMVLDIR